MGFEVEVAGLLKVGVDRMSVICFRLVPMLFRVVSRLPNENQLFLRYLMPLLHHISRSSDINGMTSVNLAICFAPSMLWPSTKLDVIKNEVPPLIQFFIEHCPDIFGEELPVLYKQAELPPSPVENMEMEFTMNPPTKKFVPTKVDDGAKRGDKYLVGHKRSDSMDSSISEESTSAEIDDEYHNRHRHNFRHNNMDAGNTNSLLRARRSGLTVSDSQLSQISQADDYAPSNQSSINSFETTSSSSSKPRPVRKRGTIVTSGQHIHHPESFGPGASSGSVGISGGSGFPGGVEKPSPKRIKKGRVPERSSSLHGPNDMIYRRPKNARTVSSIVPPAIRPVPDNAQHRRKSIATQELLPPGMVPSSSNSSFGSSSHGYSPKMLQRIQQSKELYSRHDSSHSKSTIRKHAHSFTCKDVDRPVRTIPASSSFYDTLSPLGAEELRPKLCVGSGNSKYQVRLDVPSSTKDDMHTRPILTSIPSPYIGSNGSQPYANPPTSRAGPSSGGGGYSDSPDLLHQKGKVDGEYLKVAISERFNLTNTTNGIGIPPPSTPSSASSTSTSTFSTLDSRVIVGVHETTPTREEIYTPGGSESGQDSLERVQKKLQDRKRLDGNDASGGTPTSFTNSSNYKAFLNTRQKGDSLMSLTEESSIDDRPECDMSLPRQVGAKALGSGATALGGGAGMGAMGRGGTRNLTLEVTMHHHEHDPIRTSNNGYNSDTESDPSRTLSRPGKIKEVSSPTKVTMPSRYNRGGGSGSGAAMGLHSYNSANGKRTLNTYQKQQQQQVRHQHDAMAAAAAASSSSSSSTSATKDYSNLLQSLPAEFSSSPAPAMINPSSKTTTTHYSSASSSPQTPPHSRSTSVKGSSGTGSRHRPKSGDSSRVEKLTEIYRANEKEQVNADIEFAKVKLGLIPQQITQIRQRSKSTSEKEAMKILHKLMGGPEEQDEEELTAESKVDVPGSENPPPSQEDERACKHKEWLSSAPTSAERRKAWESQNNSSKTMSSSSAQFHRSDFKSRSLRNTNNVESPPEEKVPVPTVVATTKLVSQSPDTKRKCATLPDMLNGKQTKMVKVRTYEIPEAQRIRRINLRTYH